MMTKSTLENCKLLKKFIQTLEDEDIELHDPIQEVPLVNEMHLPEDYSYFLLWSNGVSILGTEILGIGNGSFDLLQTIHREQNETNNLMPDYMIPFSPVGNGDYYCFDLENGLNDGLCPVIYWQWNHSTKDNYDKVNPSFVDWLKELIEDSLEEE